jgi:hypothetical protein
MLNYCKYRLESIAMVCIKLDFDALEAHNNHKIQIRFFTFMYTTNENTV